MSSVVDICNLALANLGDEAIVTSISPPDGSAQAVHCARFYPIVRDMLLEKHNWGFASRRASLALLSTTELPVEWAYAYGYPSCIKVRSIHLPDEVATAPSGAIFNPDDFASRPVPSNPFVIESLTDGTRVIYTNVEDATARYTGLVTDATKFTPGFVVALARLMSSYMAGPIYKGKVGMAIAKAQLEWFEKVDFPNAKANDSQAGLDMSYNTFIPSSLAARA